MNCQLNEVSTAKFSTELSAAEPLCQGSGKKRMHCSSFREMELAPTFLFLLISDWLTRYHQKRGEIFETEICCQSNEPFITFFRRWKRKRTKMNVQAKKHESYASKKKESLSRFLALPAQSLSAQKPNSTWEDCKHLQLFLRMIRAWRTLSLCL